MSRDRREPEAIRRKKQRRRTPQEIEELRKRRKNDEMRQLQEYGEVKIKKRRPIEDDKGPLWYLWRVLITKLIL